MGFLAGRAARAALLVVVAAPAGAAGPGTDAVTRGRYVFDAAGCAACHTDTANKGPLLAGGRRLKTAFGVFVSPNITPDAEHGIGRWSDQEFIRAMRDGIAPDGSPYFPVFPYPSYTNITDRDLIDLKAYIFSLPAVARPSSPHEVNPPFGWRFLVHFWKWLFFTPGPFEPDPARSAAWNRGAYLVQALVHCSECHTPRNALGAMNEDMMLAGTADGPEGGLIPNITPDEKTGIGRWTDGDIESLLQFGLTPDGDFVGDRMAEVVENTTGRLTEPDLRAVITYLRSVAPVRNKVERKKDASR